MSNMEYEDYVNQVDHPGMSSIKGKLFDRRGEPIDNDSSGDGGETYSETQSDARTKEPKMHDQATSKIFSTKMPQLQAARSGWVIYAVHPEKGQFVVQEGINLAGEEEIVSGGALQGFFVAPVPPSIKRRIRDNARRGHPLDTVVFPNLMMLASKMKRLIETVSDLAWLGPGEATDSNDVPDDVILPVPPPIGNY